MLVGKIYMEKKVYPNISSYTNSQIILTRKSNKYIL